MDAGSVEHLLHFVVDRLEVGILAVDTEMRVVLWNRFMAMHSGKPPEQVIGRNLFECFPELPQKWLEKKIRNVFLLRNYAFTSWEQRPYLFRFHHNRPITGGVDAMQQSCTFLPVKGDGDEVEHVCINVFDYTDTALYQHKLMAAIGELESEREEQKRLIKRLEEAQNQLLQSEKLASIGQLAAGVAHEINNPIGFVNSNLGALDRYVQDLLRLADAYGVAEDALAARPPEFQAVAQLKQQIEFDFLREDICSLIKESRDGLDRVKKIVQDLKDFSRVDSSQEWQWTDLNKCLESTLNVATNEIKHKAEVIKDFGALPEIECLPSQINQVFLNLLVNAAQAITGRGTITLASGHDGDWVWIAIADSGCGIAPEQIKRIFDPFYTTKPVGQGTGLGLSVSYNIVAKHGGRIEVDSLLGKGTTFRVWLPLRHETNEAVDASK
ncbi:MAG: PAS domain-containing protein [Rhodocyclales bacterium]|nr:PAS domain-containing protein [Rhodocyclales bacterium]